ncbi:DNA oxidative demethylase AlkB [Methylosinus sporium]|uniref:DNA oxidative demethylase AlkB n=1 Tax=Methylosinus sporium TaxID=428 RepID=UPI000D59C909|nr:DNA oxidative demethylase AlkB [Methylosinus sporium]PWB89340.1 DNA oxidative demethylase AlkB [Methylocystis sp. MitZ-2018]
MKDLFDSLEAREAPEFLGPGAMVLRGFALEAESVLLDALRQIASVAPFRHMTTPGGHSMSTGMTNCGAVGWVSDLRGYRYERCDPLSGAPWPHMPKVFAEVATAAAAFAGYDGFTPDACLINRYEPGARLTFHQDKNERDFAAPIATVSLGLPARFQFGGLRRAGPISRTILRHGDVCVWGGPSRLAYHAIDPVKEGDHPATGRCRVSLTFRKAM